MWNATLSPHFVHVSEHLRNQFNLDSPLYANVLPVKENYFKTIKSWDLKDGSDSRLYEGDSGICKYVDSIYSIGYGSTERDCISNMEEIFASINDKTSPGWFWTYLGFRSKAAACAHPNFRAICETIMDRPVVWNTCGKREVKELSEILQAKLRVFQIPPVEFLLLQKKFTFRISDKMKNFKWSRYGFNPYAGGFNELASFLLRKPYRFCYDVKGWDKYISLNRVYAAQRSHIPIEELSEFDFMVENVVNAKVRLLDGLVIERRGYSNQSGSGATTLDNIRAHIRMTMYLLIKAYFEKYSILPTESLVLCQHIAIYGDDIIGSIDKEFCLYLDAEWLKRQLLLFNLELKFFVVSINALDDLSFLGASFELRNGSYLPRYNSERLKFSVVNDAHKLSVSGYLSKVLTLTVMSYGHLPTFEIMLATFKSLCEAPHIANSDDPLITTYAVWAHTLNNDVLDAFFLGRETASTNFIFLSKLIENTFTNLSVFKTHPVDGGFKR